MNRIMHRTHIFRDSFHSRMGLATMCIELDDRNKTCTTEAADVTDNLSAMMLLLVKYTDDTLPPAILHSSTCETHRAVALIKIHRDYHFSEQPRQQMCQASRSLMLLL